MNALRTTLAALAAGGLLLLPACASDPREGYSFTSAHSEEYKTIAIEVFENDTFSTGIEAQLSEAIAKEIMRTTKWKVTSGRRADTVLSGTVTTSELRALSS
ncbi:MAG TPA: LPS assembly lipoprotein LptE, partial [Phycisphaerales bacterium]|nr:LPS assembly lipoprotein LptE [Phycisphaerales bacterium]